MSFNASIGDTPPKGETEPPPFSVSSKEAVVPIEANSPMIIAGPTNSGKTYWIYKLLMHPGMFSAPVKSVLYCYGVYQPLYNSMKAHLPMPIRFKQGTPDEGDINNMYDGDFHVIIMDDLMEVVVKSEYLQKLFSQYCHHRNMTAIMVSQNIFQPGKYTRTISLNSHIMVLFANKRDESQVSHLARQLAPRHSKMFMRIYQEVTRRPYGYLLVDCTPSHPEEIKLRSNVFPDETCFTYALE